MAEDLSLLARINALLDANARGVRLPRAKVEPTLTEGYAVALELDAACLRIEHRIDRVTRDIAEGHNVPADKLSGLLGRLHETQNEAEDLRALLQPLREVVAQAA